MSSYTLFGLSFYQEWSHLTDQGTCSNRNDITAELLPVRYQGKLKAAVCLGLERY